MNVGLMLAVVGLVVTLLGLPVTRANWRRIRSERGLEEFSRNFDHVRDKYERLNSLALARLDVENNGDLPILARPGWILAQPVQLDAVRMELAEAVEADGELEVTRRRARRALPRRTDGSRYVGYSQALIELGGMSHLYNGSTYRPLEVGVESGVIRLRFTLGRFYDHLDMSTVLPYEVAARDLRQRQNVFHGPYRRYLRDPFDLRRRATGLGVNTLTIRCGEGRCGFYMHRRDGAWVADGPEAIHVIPAGEFAPSDVGLQAQRDDFDLWRNIMREYAEEFLDIEEAYGRGGRPIDYVNQSPFKELEDARRSGRLSAYVLGIGLDPLDWKPSIYTVCVFDGRTFDAIFASMVERGKEGVVLTGPHGLGIPFKSESVDMYAANSSTVNAGSVCLKLAWRHRRFLGLGEN